MKHARVLIYTWSCLILLSCGGIEESGADYQPESYAQEKEIPTKTEADFTQNEPTTSESPEDSKPDEAVIATTIERKLIKNGRVGFQTDDLGKTHQTISKLAKEYKAYIANDDETKEYEQIIHKMTVRIPSVNFDKFLEAVSKGVEEFDYKEIHAQDVTAEFLDLQVRIKTKKELENRYLEILKRANSVSDLLEVERQLGEVRSDIESMEGQLKYLSNQVDFSTLDISFYKEVPYMGTGFFSRWGDGFSDGWNNLLSFIIGITSLWPFLILFVLGLLGVRKFRNFRKKGM